MSYFQDWVYYLIPAIIFLVFPIVLQANIYLDLEQKKVYFSFYIFRTVKIYGGYAKLYDHGIVFHLSKNKAILLPYSEIIDTRKKFELTKGFSVIEYRQVVEIGSESSPFITVFLGTVLQVITDTVLSVFQTRNKQLVLSSECLLYPNRTGSRVTLSAEIVFNFSLIFISFIKILLRKIIEYGRQRKKQKS